jgi:hypothetical protein
VLEHGSLAVGFRRVVGLPLLFEQSPRFEGLPLAGFEVFSIENRELRRQSIIDAFHPALKTLGEDLVARLEPPDETPPPQMPLHVHLPRLDWPRGYQPFCTWLALSREPHGYQAGPQLNVGVHADHVAIRLGWDTHSDRFGRFEFLSRRGDLGARLVALAAEQGLRFRVYASAPWPEGSQRVFESPSDLPGSFDEVLRRGVWWELGRRYELPQAEPIVCSERLAFEAIRIFETLLPVYDRIVGQHHTGHEDDPIRNGSDR